MANKILTDTFVDPYSTLGYEAFSRLRKEVVRREANREGIAVNIYSQSHFIPEHPDVAYAVIQNKNFKQRIHQENSNDVRSLYAAFRRLFSYRMDILEADSLSKKDVKPTLTYSAQSIDEILDIV